MSARRQRREMERWEANTRRTATETARTLAIHLYRQHDLGLRPYNLGLVLDPGETVWAEIYARCTLDQRYYQHPGKPKPFDPPPQPPIAPWLITSDRVVGRFADDELGGWRWRTIGACQIDLTEGSERVHFQTAGGPTGALYGPGIAPLAVAAVYKLYGTRALIEHPALHPLHNYTWGMAELGRA